MDIPDLVQQALGGEEIQAGVSLGDEDAVCLTPTRTLVYNGDGLLSDEQVEEFSHDVERIAVSEGRRKTKFLLEYIDGTRSFTVPANRDDKVLELLLEGVLRVDGVIDDRESLVGVYRFSELTLIVAEARIIKLIGEQVWNEDFEVYPYEDVTALEFERASVATSIVLGIGGRPQRVKVPNDNAPVVRQTIEKALFGYYDVASLDELNRVVSDGSGAETPMTDDASEDDDIDFGSGIDPLVTDDEADVVEHAEDALDDISTGGDAEEPASHAEETAGQSQGSPSQSGAGQQRSGDSSAQEAGDSETAKANADTGHSAGDGNRDESASAKSATANGTTSAPDSTNSSTETAGDEAAADAAGTGSETDPGGAAAADPSTRSASETGTNAGSADDTSSEAAAAVSDDADGGAAESGETTTATTSTAGLDETVEPASREDLEVVADRMEELTEAVDRQNELLKRQHTAIKQLVDQLQSE